VCIEKTRWFPAMVGNHIAEIVERYGADSDALPKSLSAYVKNRRGYDYSKHGQSDNPYLDFITPDVVESFGVLGSVEQHVAKLRQLEAAGVTQFNIYLENGDEEELIANYAEQIIPQLAKKP
jgi:alkanesulfonate monooxygenase SsuD/methylene tetrahydromethanopterin reductase-like flavin-dependent oxidoreductase (luciferase family)